VVRSHHERWDGSGYPSALIGEEIPLVARIAAVADAFDAVTSERYHARAESRDGGLEVVCAGTGSAFDPVVVEAFLEVASL
jgi:HD-GYP domain-containing protein (c-di-GMP phosphodiesterase class II)